MLYGTNHARETAREKIKELRIKLGNARPTEDILHSDIMDLLYYLDVLDDGLRQEIKAHKAGC